MPAFGHGVMLAPMEPKNVVLRFITEYQNEADERAFTALMHPDFVDHSRPPGIAAGLEGVRQQFDGFRAAFSEFRAEVLQMVAEGDVVMTRKLFHGTHTGEFQGIAPTGNEVAIHVIDVVRVRDGRIVEHWGLTNTVGLLEQVGGVARLRWLARLLTGRRYRTSVRRSRSKPG
jgi:predicted ester cyclase